MKMIFSVPALPVKEMTRSIEFYRDILAFTLVHQDGGFAIFQRDAVEVHLWEASDESWQTRTTMGIVSGAESFIAGTASCRIAVEGVDELYRELQPDGIVHSGAHLEDKPWGTREFGILDCDNNLITFLSVTE